MTHLVLLSHGSRNPKAHSGIEELAAATAQLLGDSVESVRIAHLEIDPQRTLLEVTRGMSEAIVVPLLFAGGFHARVDAPEQIAEAERVNGTTMRMAQILGAGEDMAELLADVVKEECPVAAHPVLYSVGSSVQQAQDNIEQLARRVAELSGREVEFISATNMSRGLDDAQDEHGEIHLVPLFVTEGLLLDRAREQLRGASSASSTLRARLAPIVAHRVRAAFR